MQVPIKEIVKILSQRRQVKKTVGVDDDDPPIMLQNIHLIRTNLGHDPFLLTLAIHYLLLHNCMLDSGASTNITSLKVTKQLNLNITRKYKNVCCFDSKTVEVEDLIKDLKVSLAMNKDVSLLMDVVVIDIPDVWGMLLSRKWGAIVGGQLQMDLSYATFPAPAGDMVTLYKEVERR